MLTTPVAFTSQADTCPDHLCYWHGVWHCCVDLEFYHIEERRHWFRPNGWVILKLTGANTAAVRFGGGEVWYDQIGESTRQRQRLLTL